MIAIKAQNHDTTMNACLQLYSNVEVKKLVIKAPTTFPAFPLEHQNPTTAPLPLLPNQLANIVEQAGQPKDCINPLIEKSKQKSNRLM